MPEESLYDRIEREHDGVPLYRKLRGRRTLVEREPLPSERAIAKHGTALLGLPFYSAYKLATGAWEEMKELPNVIKAAMTHPDPDVRAAMSARLMLDWGMLSAPGVLRAAPKEATLRTFGGIKGAKKAAKGGLAEAEKAIKAGADAEMVRKQTGWFLNPYDRKWRFEIDDSAMSVDKFWLPSERDLSFHRKNDWKYDLSAKDQKRFDKIDYVLRGKLKLRDIIDHPELFKAYPFLNNIQIKHDFYHMGTAFGGIIGINPKLLKPGNEARLKEVIVHEIQHLIQAHEGFARGGPDLKLAGEIESRESASRAGLTARQRMEQAPYRDGIPADEAIVRFGEGKAQMVDQIRPGDVKIMSEPDGKFFSKGLSDIQPLLAKVKVAETGTEYWEVHLPFEKGYNDDFYTIRVSTHKPSPSGFRKGHHDFSIITKGKTKRQVTQEFGDLVRKLAKESKEASLDRGTWSLEDADILRGTTGVPLWAQGFGSREDEI